MYNDVDMVWLADPFPYLEGKHDVYFTDDMTQVSPCTSESAFDKGYFYRFEMKIHCLSPIFFVEIT